METKRAVRGLRSFYVFIPTILLISVFYVFIIVSTIFIDKYTVEIAEDTEESSEIFDIIDDLQSHSSKLSATASSFAYSPTIGGPPGVGTINMALLNAYIEEFTNENK